MEIFLASSCVCQQDGLSSSGEQVFQHFLFVHMMDRVGDNVQLRQSRVTGLGEFSPIGRNCILGSCVKIAEVDQMFGLLICTVKAMH
jgi:hypothetical protein